MTDSQGQFRRARRGPRKRPQQRKPTALVQNVLAVEISSPTAASEASSGTSASGRRMPLPLRRKSSTMPSKMESSELSSPSSMDAEQTTNLRAQEPRAAKRKKEGRGREQKEDGKAPFAGKGNLPAPAPRAAPRKAESRSAEQQSKPSAAARERASQEEEHRRPPARVGQRRPIRDHSRKIREDKDEAYHHEFKRGGEVGARPSMSLLDWDPMDSPGYLRRVLMYTDSKMQVRAARTGRTRETRFAPFVLDSEGRAIPVRCAQKDYMLIDAHCDCSLDKLVQYLFLHFAEFDEITLIDESSLSQQFESQPPGMRSKELNARFGRRKLSEALTPPSELAGPNHAHETVAYITSYLAKLHGISWEISQFCYPLICSMTQAGKSGKYPNLKDCLYSYLCIVKLLCAYGRRGSVPKRIPEELREVAEEMVRALKLKMPKLRQAGVACLVGLYLCSRCRRPQMTPTADVQHGIAHLLTPLHAFIHGKFKLSGDLDDIASEIPGLKCNIGKHNLAKILCVFPFKKARTYDFVRVYRSLQSAQRVSFWAKACIMPRGGFRWSTKALEKAMRGSKDFVNSIGRNAEGSREIVVYSDNVKDLSADLYMMIQVLRRKAGRHYVYLWDADGYSDTRAEISFVYRRSRRMQVLEVSPIPEMQGWMHTRKFSGNVYQL